MEFALYLEGYARRVKQDDEGRVTASWLSAAWGRAKRLPSLRKVLGGDDGKEAKPLSKEEAEQEQARHAEAMQRLAPDATATEDQLQQFIAQQNQEYEEKVKKTHRTQREH